MYPHGRDPFLKKAHVWSSIVILVNGSPTWIHETIPESPRFLGTQEHNLHKSPMIGIGLLVGFSGCLGLEGWNNLFVGFKQPIKIT